MSKDIVNQRFINCINFLIESKKVPSKSFLAKTFNISNPKFSEILNNRMNVGVDILMILVSEFNISSEWLLTGQGEMLKEDSYLEQKNWIVNDLDKYESQKYDYNSLQRVGLRLDEICIQEKIANDLMAKKLCVDGTLFMEYIAGLKPVPCSLLNKLSALFPHLNESWLHLGYGAMIVDKQQASSSNDKYIEALEKINTLQEQIINLMQENKRLTEEITAFQESPQDRAAG